MITTIFSAITLGLFIGALHIQPVHTAQPDQFPAAQEERPHPTIEPADSRCHTFRKSTEWVEDSTEITTKRIFTIHNNMLDTELKVIEKAALAAGIDFEYIYVVWFGKVRKIEYTIKWKDADGKFYTRNESFKGTFISEIGWIENEEGKAVELLE